MGEASRNIELEARIAEVDARIPSPGARAERIWSLLNTYDPDLTTWDVLCFCAEFIGMVAQRYHWILPIARRFCGLVYTAHYQDETRVDAHSDRITRKVEPVGDRAEPDTSPKSLFDLSRADAPSNGAGRSDTSTEAPLHVSDNSRDATETSGKKDAGPSVNGDANSPA